MNRIGRWKKITQGNRSFEHTIHTHLSILEILKKLKNYSTFRLWLVHSCPLDACSFKVVCSLAVTTGWIQQFMYFCQVVKGSASSLVTGAHASKPPSSRFLYSAAGNAPSYEQLQVN